MVGEILAILLHGYNVWLLVDNALEGFMDDVETRWKIRSATKLVKQDLV
jgi:hypothetical protein